MEARLINWGIHPDGYLVAQIWNSETKRTEKVLQHRLIWEIYRGPIPEGGVIHHKNGIPSDNRIENLELLPSLGAHQTLHQNERKALGVVKNCLSCQREFVAFDRKKHCSRRCLNRVKTRQWRATHPGYDKRGYRKKIA